MAPPLEPPELAQLVEAAERPRRGDWSLRAALCRYAQPHPRHVRDVLEHVRRIDAALHGHAKRLDKEGEALWAALGRPAADGEDGLVALLRVARRLDALGDRLAEWAEDRHGVDVQVEVEQVVAEVADALDRLGVPREERARPPRDRG